ncbi:family 16 glycoside hydrolase [Tamlana sp. 2201CG12-4]|uniref:family 16 glycoside hydrolase n=1 Tax=Tamlana sp. 2201CG12-4 TaxID=3112582 RepID=UPI002DB950F1|nr:family 16 glycoside hydrolase [Tamlana sp. 2201CG12-4]MEC3905678.1 family 16 glycoside hydrolase [Tamlana sp. 2201CG12-4]
MKIKLLLIVVFFGFNLFAQEQIELNSLNDFKDQAGNWQIVGEVKVNRNIDVHDIEEHDRGDKLRKRKRRKKKIEIPTPISFKPGVGILLNINDKEKNDALVTNWEHGDLLLELEVLLPKGSNSGIYFQGRYELQLKDSWGIKNPLGSDMGGFHNNWEKDPDKIFRGIPPTSNASKAPGLWQKYKVHFQAPKFNDLGEKISNAKFISVELNGVRIHSNVELPTYTGGPIEKNEVKKGPLLIQGNHGPVAIRNFKYQLLKESSIELSSLEYITYKGPFNGVDELNDWSKAVTKKADRIDILSTGEEDEYGIVYIGALDVKEEDNYTISVGYTGGVKLIIDNKKLIENNSSSDQGLLKKEVKLSKGNHEFTLINIKSAAWRAPKLGMSIKSKSTNSKDFHTYDSYPPRVNSITPIFVNTEATPRLLRAFVAFKGNGKRLSHTIGVAMPTGLNYVYDLNSANVVGVWRGDFVDATPMWHNRGDGSFNPRGAVQWTFLNQSIAKLETANSAFPETGLAPEFVSKGYVIDKESSLPIFKHNYKGVSIENKLTSNKSDTYLVREVNFSKAGLIDWYMKIASGKIEKNIDGSYTIGDREYYINILSGQTPIIREVNGEMELVLAVDGSLVKYEIIW